MQGYLSNHAPTPLIRLLLYSILKGTRYTFTYDYRNQGLQGTKVKEED